jgi:ligand-binding sensor domain-containing protein
MRALLVAALCCLCRSPALGSGRFVNWTTEDGLPQNSVNAILQTQDGYIWLATFGGLVRYDGVQFTIFTKGNTKGLNSNRILCLIETPDGALADLRQALIGQERLDMSSRMTCRRCPPC